ncbi:2-phospho-L-lactate guanylyltransferase [Halobacteriales archaeon QS_3_64_16]|nr:MAG: 2-phospho-L-lactate guanylyltransferase [Halobacteriales archaeon QS_3_64_16]
MRVVVPFAAERPKTRLDGVLSPAERVAFAQAMLADVLEALEEGGQTPEVLATAPFDATAVSGVSAGTGSVGSPEVPVRVDDRALTPAVNAVLEASEEPVAVVMADLALATPAALGELFAAEEGVVLAPGCGGGTNALLARHPDFRVDYHGTSFLDHCERARSIGARVGTVDSFRLATDIDEPTDLPEVLLHSENRAARWLRAAGFSLAVTDGRVSVRRGGE